MAQSYTRQSSFADGDTITAALFNNEYNQLVNAFSYSSTNEATTGHRHNGSAGEGGNIPQIGDLDFLNKIVVDSTNNRWGFYVQVASSTVEQLRLQDGALIPVTDSDVDLGTSSLYFKDAYIDSITTTGNVAVGGNLTVTGTTTFNGGTITMGDAATDNVVFGADVDSNIIPDDDNTYDLGSASQEWKDIYIDGTAYLDAINFNGTAITSTAAELNILDGVTSTAAELNILDGVTSTTAEINLLDGVTSTTAELNILDGVTATSTEINILDGITSTTAELNILDGVTSTAAEINLLDGVTSTTAELNILDGVTSTAAEINLLDGKAFLDEDNMASNSATGIASQQSIKAYVDAQVTAQDLDIITDSGTIAIDLDSENLTVSGGTGLDSSATGNAVTLAIDSTVTTLTGTQTLTNKTLTSPDVNTPDIDGGTIDGSVIGGATPAAGTFTTLTANTSITGTLSTAAQANITSVGTLTGLTTSGNIVVTGTVDGRDIATDGTKLDGIEASADVTDATNVTAAGALMDSELTSIASVKALNQGVATGDSPQFVGITSTANVIVGGNLTVNGTTTTLNTATLDVEDKNITINYGAGDTTGSANGAGITIQDAVDASTDATILWDTTNDEFDFSHPINVSGKVTSTGTSVFASLDISGDIDVDGTTNLDVVDIDGAVDMASTLNVSGNITGTLATAAQTNITSVGALDGGSITSGFGSIDVGSSAITTTGTVTGNTLAGTLSTAAQPNITSLGTLTGLTTSGDINFGDNDIAKFGADADLKIYHNSNGNSIISETGGGDLFIQATNLQIENAVGDNMIFANSGGAVNLYYAAAAKLATTSTGIDVTGTATMDGLDVNGTITSYGLNFDVSDGVEINALESIVFDIDSDNNQTGRVFQVKANNSTALMTITETGNVGIGTDSPSAKLTVAGGSDMGIRIISDADGVANLQFGDVDDFVRGGITYNNADDSLQLRGYNNAIRATIDTSGNLLVGTTDTTLYNDSSDEYGIVFEPTGESQFSANNRTLMYLNRQNGDGTIVDFRKDGTPVGSIGSRSGVVSYIALDPRSNGAGLTANTNEILPTTETGALVSDTKSLGSSSWKFKDIYLSGIVNPDVITSFVNSYSATVANGAFVYISTSGSITCGVNSTASRTPMSFRNPNGEVGTISTSGSSTSYNTSSDHRLKENVTADWDATTRLKQLNPVRFNFIADADNTVDGFLAHEVQDIVPEAVTGEKDAMIDEEYEVTPAVLDDDGNVVTAAVMGTRSVPDYQGIDQSKLVPLLTKAIQEQQTIIDNLTTRIEALEG